jgi:hypothetical protein
MPFTTQPLDASTWDAFAELVERNNGIFGGCWCIGFHPEREPAPTDRQRAAARSKSSCQPNSTSRACCPQCRPAATAQPTRRPIGLFHSGPPHGSCSQIGTFCLPPSSPRYVTSPIRLQRSEIVRAKDNVPLNTIGDRVEFVVARPGCDRCPGGRSCNGFTAKLRVTGRAVLDYGEGRVCVRVTSSGACVPTGTPRSTGELLTRNAT